MADLDIDKLVAPVSEDSPCGDDLEYDPEFGELDRIAQGKPGHEMGDEVIEPEPPDWSEVADAATALFARTKDLRIATHLAHAQLNLDGLPGFASGLELIHRLLKDYWEHVHPQLDEEDDNDPTLRVNSLMPLNSREVVIRSLDRTVLVSSRALGRFSLRDIRLANGEITLPEGDDTPVPDPAHIDAAFLDCELDELSANSEAADKCVSVLNDIEAYTLEQVGAELSPELGELSSELNAVRGILKQQLSRRGVAVEALEGEAAGEGAEAPSMSGEIRSRDDAIRVLDRVAEYFRKNEPSSPVPLVLQRAKRLISKDFMEILRDIAPQGVSEAEQITGLNRDD
jgi:type VI secretion system protein ImpA